MKTHAILIGGARLVSDGAPGFAYACSRAARVNRLPARVYDVLDLIADADDPKIPPPFQWPQEVRCLALCLAAAIARDEYSERVEP